MTNAIHEQLIYTAQPSMLDAYQPRHSPGVEREVQGDPRLDLPSHHLDDSLSSGSGLSKSPHGKTNSPSSKSASGSHTESPSMVSTSEGTSVREYSIADAHLNPKYYPESHKYNPSRWLQPNPVPGVVYPFLGSGAGRHPCTGMKVAKLEMK